jgi:hypothetical protein
MGIDKKKELDELPPFAVLPISQAPAKSMLNVACSRWQRDFAASGEIEIMGANINGSRLAATGALKH